LVSSTRHGYDKDKLPYGYPSHYASTLQDGSQLKAAAGAKDIDDLSVALSPTGNKYIEAQVHGKVTPDDIDEIHFEPRGFNDRPTAAIAQLAKDKNIKLFVDGKALTAQEIDDIIKPPIPDKRTPRMKSLSDALDKKDFDSVIAYAEAIYDDINKVPLAPGEQDAVLKTLYRESGFDQLPEVVSKADMDKLSDDGAVMMARGVGRAGATSAATLAEQFRSGDYFTGNGIYGNGTYVGHSGQFAVNGKKFVTKSTKTTQKAAWKKVKGHGYITSSGSTLRMALKPGAKVVTATTMIKELNDLDNDINNWEKKQIGYLQKKYSGGVLASKTNELKAKVAKMKSVLGVAAHYDNPPGDRRSGTSGRYAVVRGYDAVALNNSYEPKNFMNLMNRSAVYVQDTDLPYYDGINKGVAS
jgi:hypothetical protein